MSEPRLHVLDNPAFAVAEILADEAARQGTIVLTGGSTPEQAYAQAAELNPFWSLAHVWWSDERCVRPTDARSNYGMAKRALFDRLDEPPSIHRIRGELEPEQAAADYAQELDDNNASFDLLLLGLGPDGHVASLFPGSPQLDERDRLVTSGPASLEPFVDRVTLTVPALLSASRIVFLVTGAEKAEAVARAFGGGISEDAPASLLRTGTAPIDVYLDAAAGSTGSAR